MTRTAKLLLIPILLLQVLLFTFIAQHRFVDTDEGFYLLASRLILMHKKPYLDFFFQQAPLLPYVYALWLKCFHISWVSARILPALLTTLLGLLLYEHACHETENWIAGVSAVAMFATSTLIFAWFPIAKPYSLAGLFLFAAYVVVTRVAARSALWLSAAGGSLLALAVDTRSYLLLTAPLFLWWIAQNSSTRSKLNSILSFLGGFTVGLVPSLYFFLSSPRAFVFDNLGYHAIRTNAGLVGMWGEKFVVVLMSFLGGPEGNGIQNSILFVVSLGFVFSIYKPGRAPRLAFQIAVVVALISLLPTPVLPQYFCFCIPFLIVSTVCVVNDLTISVESKKTRLFAVAACVLLAGVYVAASVNDFRKYLIAGDGIPTVRLAYDKGDWRLQRVIEVSRAIDQIARPGEIVASFWSGYIFQTKVTPFPGLETDCGLAIADKLDLEQRGKYHIISWAQTEANFAAHLPRVVVVPNHQYYLEGEVVGDRAKISLLTNGYTLARSIGDTSIYVCCSNAY